MIGKLLIPVVDVDSYNFDCDQEIDRDTYSLMVYDSFMRNDKRIQRFADSIRNKEEFDFGERRDYNGNATLKYVLSESETLFLDKKRNDLDGKYIADLASSGKMGIIIMSINPESLSNDAEGEIRFWMGDSNKVLRDGSMNDRAKLRILPKMNFIYESDGGERYILCGCKMFEDYSNDKQPYYFAIIIEKIIKR